MYGIIDDAYLTDIASAIRSKTGTSDTFTLSQMAGAISGIQAEGGGDAEAIITRKISALSGDYSVIGYGAFCFCERLTTVNLPACVSVATSAFYACTHLTTANLPACTSVSDYAFHYCSALTSVSLPVCENVKSNVFNYCSALTSVNLPLCKSIGNYAFAYCSALTSVNLPLCTSIGGSAFWSCIKLISLYLTSVSIVPSLKTNVFASTPIGEYSASAGQFGSVFVPMSLVDAFKVATNWSSIADRIVGV